MKYSAKLLLSVRKGIRNTIEKQVEEGKTDREIANNIGFSVDYIRRIRREELGIMRLRGSGATKAIINNKARKSLIRILIYLKDRKYSLEKLARIVKLPIQTVSNLIKDGKK